MRIVRKTIGRMLNEIAAKVPNKEALIHTDVNLRYNYSLLLWEVDRAAKGLIQLGIESGDRVALWAPNIPEWIVAQFAISKIGAILVPIDPGTGLEDLQYLLKQSESRAIIMARGLEGDEYLDLFLEARDHAPSLEHVILIARESQPETVLWTELLGMGDDPDSRSLEEREKLVNPEDPVAIMYTSGTTGVPKGVMLDHLGLINKSLASAKRQGLTGEDRLCLFFPLFHMFGNTCIALTGLLTGATLVMPCLAFDSSKVLKAVYKEKTTAVFGSPSMIIALLDHPEFKSKRWGSVKKGIIGGAACPMELMKRLVQREGVSNMVVGYGITEANSWITMTHPDDPLERRTTTIGIPLECNQVKIVNPATGRTLPPNTQGELCVKGLLMIGYYKMPAATASAVDKQGWFHSGDLGEIDEQGYVKLTGRLKDVIVRGGVPINPVELEETLYTLPEVSEVQVFGFPHDSLGQEVAAWIRLKEGAKISLLDVESYAKRRIDKAKMPHHFKFVNAFPMTRSGKVQKFKLAELARKEYGAQKRSVGVVE
ncbi:MAG: AMP-binding protein [Deltaproteobacteria bacterium]